MRKLTQQICMSLGLVMMMAFASSVQAQTLARYTAQIPFDFNIGNKTYRAGEYVINMRNQPSVAKWTLADTKGRDLKIISGMTNLNCSRNGKASLLFSRYENQNFLTDMSAPNFGMRIGKAKLERQLAKKPSQPNAKPEIVAVVLSERTKKI